MAWVRDVVVCGLNEPYVALLVWPNLNAASEVAGSDDPAEPWAMRLDFSPLGAGIEGCVLANHYATAADKAAEQRGEPAEHYRILERRAMTSTSLSAPRGRARCAPRRPGCVR